MKLLSVLMLIMASQVSANDQCAYVSIEAAQNAINEEASKLGQSATKVAHAHSTEKADTYSSVVNHIPYLITVYPKYTENKGCVIDENEVSVKKLNYRL